LILYILANIVKCIDSFSKEGTHLNCLVYETLKREGEVEKLKWSIWDQ